MAKAPPIADDWGDAVPEIVTRNSKLTDLRTLEPWPDNPNEGDVGAIANVMRSIGWFGACIYQKSTRRIIVGNHRVQAAMSLGLIKVPAMEADVDDATATDMLLADNETGHKGRWNEPVLANLLAKIERDRGLTRTGFDQEQLQELLESLGDRTEAGLAGRSSSLLERVDVSVGDPQRSAVRGDVWRLGRHVLIVNELMSGWQDWIEYLNEAEDPERTVFVPYPGPYLPLARKADNLVLVMVQPDPYIAGHILDKWISVRGEEEVRRDGED